MRFAAPDDMKPFLGYAPSEQQWPAVSAPLAPSVVIAGAGTGKTSVMEARVLYLVGNGLVRPEEVLGLTFTRKATAELGGRIRAGLARLPRADADPLDGGLAGEPTVLTYDSYIGQLLGEHGLRHGIEPDTRLVAGAQRYQLAVRAIRRSRLVGEHLSPDAVEVAKAVVALDGELSQHLRSPAEVAAHDAPLVEVLRAEGEAWVAASPRRKNVPPVILKAIETIHRRRELLHLVEEYRALKRELGVMDFGDQTQAAVELIRAHPAVAESERSRYRVVLLDEYQDTSTAQADLLAGLFAGHAVMAVGDPKQAIYGWRGASVSNIARFAERFGAGGPGAVPVHDLTVSRRSGRGVVAAANRLASRLYDLGHGKPLEARDGAGDGEVHTAFFATDVEERAWLRREVRRVWDELSGPGAPAVEPGKKVAVLAPTRDALTEAYEALLEAGLPVEMVGLSGLVDAPEIVEVTSMLRLLRDMGDNAALLRLLLGNRFAVAPRDLALLGGRSRELAGSTGRTPEETTVEEQMEAVVGEWDRFSGEALALALEDPGRRPYSPQALAQFARLRDDLRHLRGFVGEPVGDLVRRVIDVIGIEVELASSLAPRDVARRDNLAALAAHATRFQSADGHTDLAAFLAWLDAEAEVERGLDYPSPSDSDSVKLLTIHSAKGLEWEAVFVVGVTEGRFPSERARETGLTAAHVLPFALRRDHADLPQLRGHAKEDIEAFADAWKDALAVDELRTGYVAWTRPRTRLHVSGWRWRERNKRPRARSAYMEATREVSGGFGDGVHPVLTEDDRLWDASPFATVARGEADEAYATVPEPWPMSRRSAEVERREAGARLVAGIPAPEDASGELDARERELVAQWDDRLDRLAAEVERARSEVVEVPMPASLSATALLTLHRDPERFARELARPLPRKPVKAARFGTEFHARVEARFGQQGFFEPDDLPGRADEDIEDESDLDALFATFAAGVFGDRAPYAVEVPFALALAGHAVRGRIDAVYREPDGSWLVVDWKTNRRQDADPVQLAVYRAAWADLSGSPEERVRAAFYYVRTDTVVEPPDLLGRDRLERVFPAPAPIRDPAGDGQRP